MKVWKLASALIAGCNAERAKGSRVEHVDYSEP